MTGACMRTPTSPKGLFFVLLPNSLENLDSLVRLRSDHGCNLAMNFEQLGELLIFRTPSQAAFRSYTRRSGEVTLENRQPLLAAFHPIGVVNQARVHRGLTDSQVLQRVEVLVITAVAGPCHLHVTDGTIGNLGRFVGHL